MVLQRYTFAGLFVVGAHGSGGFDDGCSQKGDHEERNASNDGVVLEKGRF